MTLPMRGLGGGVREHGRRPCTACPGSGPRISSGGPDPPFHHLGFVNARVPAFQLAASDPEVVLFTTPELAACLQAA